MRKTPRGLHVCLSEGRTASMMAEQNAKRIGYILSPNTDVFPYPSQRTLTFD